MDQVITGSKPHIRTQFIGQEWISLNAMKSEVIPYDAAHWEINHRATGEKSQMSTSTSKAPYTQERVKSSTPQVKAETSKVGGTS